jgi:uncharacterized protein YjaZ
MKKYFLLVLCCLSLSGWSQTYFKSIKSGDSLLRKKQYKAAAASYLQGVELADIEGDKPNDLLRAVVACTLAGDTANAFIYLEKALAMGYSYKGYLNSSDELFALQVSPKWKALQAKYPKAPVNTDPRKARLITSDVDNFWDAYDRAQKDTANRKAIYKKYYVDKGTVGLQDYLGAKVRTMNGFVKSHDLHPKFYASIRNNTLTVPQQKKQMLANMITFKKIYPQAQFPDIYFVIGSYTSGGTASDNGLLIGLDQSVRSPEVDQSELSIWEKNNFPDLAELPHLVAHELIHFQQDDLGPDSTLLKAVLVEGMADFLATISSGSSINTRLQVYGKGREKQIWTDFKKEMYHSSSRNWIGNSDQETEDHPADLGYWVGYQICKAYYDKSTDKKKAVYDMLHITNYQDFYERSGAEKLMMK